MKIRVIYFTDNGQALAAKVFSSWTENIVYRTIETLDEFVEAAFREQTPLIFIGAMGIAVRGIAPYIKDKTKDIPVIVMDEMGYHVIPVLSGHLGGAIELAQRIAKSCSAEPVITTATDLNGAFAVDSFAKSRNLTVKNPSKIKLISGKALCGEDINIAIDVAVSEKQPKEDMLWLRPKLYVLGIGTRKGKSFCEIADALEEFLSGIDDVAIEDIYQIASIDVKKDEEGILELSQRTRIPFITYSADELRDLEGEFTHSQFVEQTVGVGCVSERAAVKAAGEGAQLVVKKTTYDGITFALAKCKYIMEI